MNKKNEKQIMIEQVSMQIIMRIRQIIQEMSKYSKYILENYKIQRYSRVLPGKEDFPLHDSKDNFGPVVVPSDHCFVLGDNRDKSWDSRHWGYLPLRNIIGKVLYIYWSKDILQIGIKLE